MTSITGRLTLAAPRGELWEVLSEPARLAATLPNVSSVRPVDRDRFDAVVRPETSIGVTALPMRVRIVEREGGRRIAIEGRAVAADRAIHLDAVLVLAEADAGTLLEWTLVARLFGPLRALTQRVLADILRAELERTLRAAADACASVG